MPPVAVLLDVGGVFFVPEHDRILGAFARAGLNPAFKGTHLLRHSLASEMLRRGASLGEIGEILRHRLPSTTEIYAKVDLEGLRTLAQPWPGGHL